MKIKEFAICGLVASQYQLHQIRSYFADIYQWRLSIAGNFFSIIRNKISGQLLAAEIFQNPVEYSRNLSIRQCRLGSTGNLYQELPSTRNMQEAAYFILECRYFFLSAGAVHQVATLTM